MSPATLERGGPPPTLDAEEPTIRAVLIPVEGEPREVALPERDGLERLQQLVEGDIEAIDVGREDATAYGNDEAKLVNMELNRRATDLVFPDPAGFRRRSSETKAAYEAAGYAVIEASPPDPRFREPFVAGPLVVCGFDPYTGENRSIPDNLAAQLLEDDDG